MIFPERRGPACLSPFFWLFSFCPLLLPPVRSSVTTKAYLDGVFIAPVNLGGDPLVLAAVWDIDVCRPTHLGLLRFSHGQHCGNFSFLFLNACSLFQEYVTNCFFPPSFVFFTRNCATTDLWGGCPFYRMSFLLGICPVGFGRGGGLILGHALACSMPFSFLTL